MNGKHHACNNFVPYGMSHKWEVHFMHVVCVCGLRRNSYDKVFVALTKCKTQSQG